MTVDLFLVPAIAGTLFLGWLAVHTVQQIHSRIIYGKWLAHPLAEKVALLEALLVAADKRNAELQTKLTEQDGQMQEVYATLMAKISGG